ncbi:MAG: hypothetical protein JNK21_10310 [Rhodospirillaceae bacterium]|nr:hypothetical protein [Rhodospirillaceae bacterium]
MDLEQSSIIHRLSLAPALRRKGELRRAAVALALVLTTGLGLSACGVKPFVDGRREAGQKTPVGPSTPDRVAICYSSQGAAPADVLALAQAECAKTNRTARFDGQDQFSCALLAPTRAFFRCVAN